MPNPPPTSIFHPRRILVRGVNWLGDAVMTTPALLRLRERFPEAHIALLSPEKLGDLWRPHPVVNEVLTFAAGESLFVVRRKLRAGNFDLALMLPNSPRSALEAWLARIPQRIGYARPWRNWFLTQTISPRSGHVRMRKKSESEIRSLTGTAGVDSSIAKRPSPNATAHQIHEYLHLTAALGANPAPLAPQLSATDREIAAVRARFQLDPNRAIFALNPGAEYGPAKRWPAERFIAAAREIQQRTNCFWLILGGKTDVELATRITTEITHHAPRYRSTSPASLRSAN